VFFHERDGDIEGKARNRDARLRGDSPALACARALLALPDASATIAAGDALHRTRRHACPARVVVRAARSEI
jgi:hypothetical protein